MKLLEKMAPRTRNVSERISRSSSYLEERGELVRRRRRRA